MNQDIQKRLYGLEVNPPAEVWSRLSIALDEINADNKLAAKIYEAETEPGTASWERINNLLNNETLTPAIKNNGALITLRRLAVAAVVIGLIVSSYFLFFNRKNESSGVVSTEQPVKSTEIIKRSDEKKDSQITEENQNLAESNNTPSTKDNIARQASVRVVAKSRLPGKPHDDAPALLASANIEVQTRDHLEDKTFKEPIDDLSLIASNNNYVSIVSADGRLVKIPSHLASLAPYLQQKPSDADYLDILFEESTYWKDKFREWRQKLAESPVTPSIDNFFDIIGLMKTIQEN